MTRTTIFNYISFLLYIWIVFTKSVTLAADCVSDGADIVFVVDDSSSVQRGRFSDVLEFVQGIVGTLPIGPADNLVSFISFSSTVKSQFDLDKYTTQSDLLRAIGNIRFRGGGTNIERALKMAEDSNFQPQNGARSGVGKVLVLITDGSSSVDDAVPQSIRDAGIKIVCVGIADADETQLQMIAGDTGYVHIIQTFDDLTVIQTQISTVTCEATQQSACDAAPCTNGGTCIDTTGGRYTCTCPAQFTGDTCEIAIQTGPVTQPSRPVTHTSGHVTTSKPVAVTQTESVTTTKKGGGRDDGLPGWAIALIVLASAVGLTLVVACICCVLRG